MIGIVLYVNGDIHDQQVIGSKKSNSYLNQYYLSRHNKDDTEIVRYRGLDGCGFFLDLFDLLTTKSSD